LYIDTLIVLVYFIRTPPGGRAMKKVHSHIDETTKEDILRRLAIAKGHLDRVYKMLEGNAYCPDVIHQSRAVQASLQRIDEIVLDNHLSNCVLGEHEKTLTKEQTTQEIMEVFRKKK